MTTNKVDRKERPIFSGVLSYFPDAIAEVAHVSFVGNQQHNPGQPLHWARDKSKDHADCIARHLMENGTLDDDGLRHSAKVAWRALALLQTELENEYKKSIDSGEIRNQEAIQRIDTLIDHTDTRKVYGGKIYIAGPMRGYTEFNFPAFDKAKEVLKKLGWDVISPADLDRDQDKGVQQTQRHYAKRDCAAILECDAIYMLKGWSKSVGATAEHAVAVWAGLKIYGELE